MVGKIAAAAGNEEDESDHDHAKDADSPPPPPPPPPPPIPTEPPAGMISPCPLAWECPEEVCDSVVNESIRVRIMQLCRPLTCQASVEQGKKLCRDYRIALPPSYFRTGKGGNKSREGGSVFENARNGSRALGMLVVSHSVGV